MLLPGCVAALASALAFAFVLQPPRPPIAGADALPRELSDARFWTLSGQLSEPEGYFKSKNRLSNELYYPEVLDTLAAGVAPGGVYLGVGPEQNFSYIAAVRPDIAFITDVRRANLHLHLMYKALFELSADRAEFVSRLFTKPRPVSLTSASSVQDIMDAYWTIESSSREVFDRNLREIEDHLTTVRALPLSPGDLEGIADVYSDFYWYGPSITYNSTSASGFGRNRMANYYQLMLSTDKYGRVRSYLGSEEAFRFVKDLQLRNLIVPVVGHFGGPHALRAIGQWLDEHEAAVSVFYLSNVEQYLRQEGLLGRFCANVKALPLAEGATFVRSQSGGGGFRNLLGDMHRETAACAAHGPAVEDDRGWPRR